MMPKSFETVDASSGSEETMHTLGTESSTPQGSEMSYKSPGDPACQEQRQDTGSLPASVSPLKTRLTCQPCLTTMARDDRPLGAACCRKARETSVSVSRILGWRSPNPHHLAWPWLCLLSRAARRPGSWSLRGRDEPSCSGCLAGTRLSAVASSLCCVTRLGA